MKSPLVKGERLRLSFRVSVSLLVFLMGGDYE